MDRGTAFSFGYLGSSPLGQLATGLGSLQKPLRELYIKHRKPGGKGTFLPECHVNVTSNGLRMTYREAPEMPHIPPREDFYPVENIIMWDTVRFVAVKTVEKKKTMVRFAFEPLDNDHSRNKDNLFNTLDKKFLYLQDQQHPPIFTCVLRRKSGVKALDIHAFFCDSDTEALELVRALNFLQNSFQSNQAQETGVFGYSPFGGKTAQGSSATGGSQRQRLAINRDAASLSSPVAVADSTRQSVLGLATAGGGVTAGASHQQLQHSQMPRQNQRQSSTSLLSLQDLITTTSPIDPGSRGGGQLRQSAGHHQKYNNNNIHHQVSGDNIGNRSSVVVKSASPSPFNSSERGGISGSQKRIYHLSQEDLLSPQLRVAPHHTLGSSSSEVFPEEGDEDTQVVDDGYQYLPHVTHSLERRQQRDLGAQDGVTVTNNDFVPPHFASGRRWEDDNSVKVTNVDDHPIENSDIDDAGPRYVSKINPERKSSSSSTYSENKPFNYLGGLGSSQKKAYNGSGPSSKEGSLTRMGQGYSLLSGSNERPQSLLHHPDSSNPVAGYDGGASSGYEGGGSGSVDQNRQIFKELLHLQKKQPYQGRPSPSSNEGSLERHQRPLLRPPKSPGYLDKPPTNRSKNEEPESSSPEDNNDVVTAGNRTSGIVATAQSQITEPFKTRGMSDSQQVKTKPIARVPPHKVTGVRVMPINFDSSSVPKRNDNDALSPNARSERPKSGMFLQSPTEMHHHDNTSFDNPPKRSHSQHNIITQESSEEKPHKSVQKGGSNSTNNSGGKQGSGGAANWHFGASKNSSRESSLKSQKQQEKKDLANNMDDNKLGEKLLLSKKKDAEIASVMQNLRLDYRDAPTLTPGATGGMNFEKSLGYFP